MLVDDVDERYFTFRARGLDTTQRPDSPVHSAPVDQTWGLREFAVTDPDGQQPLSLHAQKITYRSADGTLYTRDPVLSVIVIFRQQWFEASPGVPRPLAS